MKIVFTNVDRLDEGLFGPNKFDVFYQKINDLLKSELEDDHANIRFDQDLEKIDPLDDFYIDMTAYELFHFFLNKRIDIWDPREMSNKDINVLNKGLQYIKPNNKIAKFSNLDSKSLTKEQLDNYYRLTKVAIENYWMFINFYEKYRNLHPKSDSGYTRDFANYGEYSVEDMISKLDEVYKEHARQIRKKQRVDKSEVREGLFGNDKISAFLSKEADVALSKHSEQIRSSDEMSGDDPIDESSFIELTAHEFFQLMERHGINVWKKLNTKQDEYVNKVFRSYIAPDGDIKKFLQINNAQNADEIKKLYRKIKLKYDNMSVLGRFYNTMCVKLNKMGHSCGNKRFEHYADHAYFLRKQMNDVEQKYKQLSQTKEPVLNNEMEMA